MGLLFQDESYAVIGAAQEVHKILGNGFLEAVYQEALGLEFRQRGIPYKKEKELRIEYKGQVLARKYQADFVCYEKIIVELKAVENLSSGHESQLLNYLNATGLRVGLLFNFGEASLKCKRFIL